MKSVQITSKNKRGDEATFTIESTHLSEGVIREGYTGGNNHNLIIRAPFQIEKISDGLLRQTSDGISIGAESAFSNSIEKKVTKNDYVQLIVMPEGGSKKDRYTLQIHGRELADK